MNIIAVHTYIDNYQIRIYQILMEGRLQNLTFLSSPKLQLDTWIRTVSTNDDQIIYS
ncbi:hypothetical protein BH23THE1_BH23THE1_26980 [soil metagenome]